MLKHFINVFVLVMLTTGNAFSLEPVFIPLKIDGPVHDPGKGTFWYGPFNEGHAVLDINNDGILDIACGPNWYEGPTWKKHEGFRSDNIVCEYPVDVNKDGYMDIVSGGWLEKGVYWYRNPGPAGGKWDTVKISEETNTEGIIVRDIDGDGDLDILVNHWAYFKNQGVTWFELMDKGGYKIHRIGERGDSHGCGVGDINGDGRNDIVTSAGWYEAPEHPSIDPWKFHAEYQLPVYPELEAGIEMIVTDVDRDGKNDIIYGNGHGYGLFWLRQNGDGTWTRKVIEDSFGQFHTLVLADINQDGVLELVTGKRLRGHDDADASTFDPLFMFWYKINGGEFKRHVLSFNNVPWYKGMEYKSIVPNFAIGGGMNITVRDMNGDGLVDVVCSGKSGLYLFLNRGLPPTKPMQ
jgi:hypothetical protein